MEVSPFIELGGDVVLINGIIRRLRLIQIDAEYDYSERKH